MQGHLIDCGPCPYLAQRRFHAFHPHPNPPAVPYRLLMDNRFRRSGNLLYMPMCPGCTACQPVRIDVPAFDDGGVPGGELHARDRDGRLIAVSVCDRFADALSSVYCYYDPELSARSLGTFMALAEIGFCHANDLRWWYLGFLVRGSPKMAYKARFCPQEVLEDGVWVRYDEPVG
mgnify:CR=1 FL=1